MTEIRRHVSKIVGKIPAGKTKIMPLLWHVNKTEATSTTLPDALAETTKIYPTGELPDKSRAMSYFTDIQTFPTVPTDSGRLDYYTGTIATSFHDLKSQEVHGLSITADDVPIWSVDGNTTPIGNALSPEISMSQQVYMATDTLKHWWSGLRKLNILQQGAIHHYRGRVFIPRKCIRSNRGMFFGMIMMNDSDVELSIEADLRFTEIPVNV